MGDTRHVSAKTAPIDITSTLQPDEAPVAKGEVVFGINDLSVSYGSNLALAGVSLDIYKNLITAMIGPSGCGKSTFIRCLNRMNDLVPGVKVDGKILYHGQDLTAGRRSGRGAAPHRDGVPAAEPFPKSIYDNVAFAPKKLGPPRPMHERVEGASTEPPSGTR